MINLRNIVLGNPSRLRFIIRFSNCPRIHNESVSDHSFYVALYTYYIAMDLQAAGEGVSLGRALSKALIHDMDECFSGDFIRMFKHSNPSLKKEVDNACSVFMKKFCWDVAPNNFVSQNLFEDWSESKKDLEGKLVSFADYLSVLSYIHQEIDLGNHRMERQVPELVKFHATFLDPEYEFLASYVLEAGDILEEIKKSIGKGVYNESTRV